MIKLQTVEVVSVTTAFLLKVVVELRRLPRTSFPRQNDPGSITRVHYLINLKKVVLFIIYRSLIASSTHPEAHGIDADATRGVDSSIPGKKTIIPLNQLKITSPVRCDSNFLLIICSLFLVFVQLLL